MSQKTKNVKGFFIGFLAGGVVSATVAFLTAPKSGKNLRKQIKQKSEEYFDEVDKYLTETKHNTGKVLDESRKKFATILHDMKSKPKDMYREAGKAISNVKDKSVDALSSGKKRVETETERLTSSVEAGIESYNDEKKK